MENPKDLPDWTRGFLLVGRDSDGNPVVLLVDTDGQLQILLRGLDAGGDPQTVKVDSDGQLYTVLRGADGVDVAVDASGFLSALLKGIDGGAVLRTIAVDTSGRIIMVPYGTTTVDGGVDVTQVDSIREVQGADGETLRTVVVDSSGQMIMVPRGQSGYYMNVDSNGFLTAVLKGIRDSTLTTIAVDTNGRIEAFSVDAEDQWSETLLTGNSELADRLGGPAAYDWRGQVLTFSTFEHGKESLYATLGAADAVIAISPDYSLMGGYSLKMFGCAADPWTAKVQGLVGTNPTDRVGLTVCWSGYYTYDKVHFALFVRKAATRYIGRMEYDPGSGTISYMDSDGNFQSLGAVWLTNYPYAFNWLKLVIDVSTGKYVRALLNDVEYDLSAHSLDTDALGFSKAIELEIVVYSADGENYGIYLDRWVITVNEP